jgi:cytochrome c oxidase subunit IV
MDVFGLMIVRAVLLYLLQIVGGITLLRSSIILARELSRAGLW